MLSIAESKTPISEAERVLREVVTAGMTPVDRVLRLEIGMKWEVGEVGVGGGLKVNEPMDLSPLKLVSWNSRFFN
jgi:mediator of RNA polymerase II transcription subunit 14